MSKKLLKNKYQKELNNKYHEKFKINKVKSKHYDKWSAFCDFYKFDLNFETNEYIEINKRVEEFFDYIANQLKKDFRPKDKIRIIIFHPSIDEAPINFPFIECQDFNGTIISNIFLATAQSKRSLKIDNELTIKSEVLKMPFGSGFEQDDSLYKNDKFVIKVINNDNFCLIRAVLIGIHVFNKTKNIRYFLKNKKNIIELDSHVKNFVKEKQIEDTELGLEHVKILEDYFGYQITIYDENYSYSKKPIYIGELKNKFIYLYYSTKDKRGHYDVIKSMSSFFNASYFCDFCKNKYEVKFYHRCKFICFKCKEINCKDEKLNLYCECGIYLNNLNCMDKHMSMCVKITKCSLCNKIKNKNHVWKHEHKFCFNCQMQVDYNHRCFILKEKIIDKKITGFIFFDYECMQEINGQHTPNLIITHTYNLNDELVEKKYFNNNISFCEYLFKQKNHIAFAHNLKGYDGMFIVEYLLNNACANKKAPKFLMIGHKFLKIEYNNIIILDSFSYLQMSLSQFSKTFDLEEIKGYFPHFFNTKENQLYSGIGLPSIEMYGYDNMSVKERLKFKEWYDRNKQNNFNMYQELVKYCESDVNLLAKGILKFRRIILENTNLEPFFNSSTIAGLSHFIFRQIFMKENSIGCIPHTGYNPKEKTSFKAKCWLRWLETKDKIKIISSENNFEKQIGPYKLDGYNISELNEEIGYEFHGCLFHGCPDCYSKSTFNTVLQQYMYQINDTHNERIAFLRKNIKLVEIWECKWDALVKNNIEIQLFIKNLKFKPPLEPRDALFGGRTNAFKLYHKCKVDEKGKYIDINSLYPSVNKYDETPIGHPEIITNNFKDVREYFGLILCEVLPPKDLFFPILPAKINNKLIFTLCYTCAKNNLDSCEHEDEERKFLGTFCTPEINLALEYKYKF